MGWGHDDPTGYIYLRHQRGVGYCFGRTKNLEQRNNQYRKPNPLIAVPISSFHTRDMFAAEKELIHRIGRQFLFLYATSDEWAKEKSEVLEIWKLVMKRHHWRANSESRYYPFERQIPLFSEGGV